MERYETAARRDEDIKETGGYTLPLTPEIGPVFRGLTDGGVTGKQLAKTLGVAPSTISKWRRGAAPAPGDVVQFLTLMLADLIQDKERTLDAMDHAPLAWRLGRESELAALRQALARQEVINRTLAGASVRDGARMFKNWLEKSMLNSVATAPQRVRLTA